MTEAWYLVAGSDSLQVHQVTDSFYGTTLEGIGMPPVQHVTQRAPRQDGSTRVATVLNDRTIDVGYIAIAASRQAFWENRFNVAEYLKQFDSLVLRIVLDSGESYDIDVAFLAETFQPVGTTKYFHALRLQAFDPLFRATGISTLTVGVAVTAGGDFTFPLTFPIVFGGGTSVNQSIPLTYDGSWAAYPQIDIRGPISNPSIVNETTDEELAMTVTVDDGDVVRIDLNPRGKSVWHITDDENWMNYLDSDSDLATWHLEPAPVAPNGINDLTFSGTNGGSNTAITLRWYDQFVAIGRRA